LNGLPILRVYSVEQVDLDLNFDENLVEPKDKQQEVVVEMKMVVEF
jgi:hypothetical protein